MGKHRTSTGDETLRFFVTGTDTGVGKTEAACALLSLLADADLRPAAMKPYKSDYLDRRWHGWPVPGPVPYVRDQTRLRAAYRVALRPLLDTFDQEGHAAPVSLLRAEAND